MLKTEGKHFTVSIFYALCSGYTQIALIPCFTGTGCGSDDVGTQFTVMACCSMPSTLSYRPAIGSEACLPCHGMLCSH